MGEKFYGSNPLISRIPGDAEWSNHKNSEWVRPSPSLDNLSSRLCGEKGRERERESIEVSEWERGLSTRYFVLLSSVTIPYSDTDTRSGLHPSLYLVPTPRLSTPLWTPFSWLPDLLPIAPLFTLPPRLPTELPTQGPLIQGSKTHYQVGDVARLNCTSAKSKPAAELTWYINDEKVRVPSDLARACVCTSGKGCVSSVPV